MTVPTLIFVHGWGLGPSMWDGVRSALGDSPGIVLDLGFRSESQQIDIPCESPLVAVGHSLGLLWLLHERPFVWNGMVSVGGFGRFTASDDFPDGIAARVLDRMRRRFPDAPEAVTSEFLSRCGADLDTAPFNASRLAEGLDWLATWDCRDVLADQKAPILALAAPDDPIVPAPMTEATFDKSVTVWHQGGHLLPLSAPDWCAEQIETFVATRCT